MTEQNTEVPNIIGGAKVILYVLLENRKPTGKTEHIHIGKIAEPIFGLAICKYDNEEGFYLFGCNSRWESETDTWHETIEEALDQAEWEYEDLADAWQLKY